jgi:GNAT superfamily N-acetyltransferase
MDLARVPASLEWVSDESEINIDSFESTDPDLTGFFLKECVIECTEEELSRTHFLVDSETGGLIGFITLACREMMTYKSGPRGIKNAPKSPPDFWPAIRIGQIAVTKEQQRRGFGSTMISTWLAFIETEIRPSIGCRYVLAEGYEGNHNIPFFRSHGFEIVPETWMKESRRTRPKEGETLLLMALDLQSRAK